LIREKSNLRQCALIVECSSDPIPRRLIYFSGDETPRFGEKAASDESDEGCPAPSRLLATNAVATDGLRFSITPKTLCSDESLPQKTPSLMIDCKGRFRIRHLPFGLGSRNGSICPIPLKKSVLNDRGSPGWGLCRDRGEAGGSRR
jgi:hypothetical protein